MQFDISRIIKILRDIIEISSPCGFTYDVSNYIQDFIRGLGFNDIKKHRDSVYIKINGRESRHIPFVCSHFDTLGAMVSSIHERGRLGFTKIGFYHLSVIENENVWVITSSGERYRGTAVYKKPTTHVFTHQELDEKRSLDNMEIRLDTESQTKKDLEKTGIRVGDYIAFDTRFEHTETGFIKSRYLDDKASVAIMLYALELISKLPPEERIMSYFYFSDLEEIGYGVNMRIPDECNLVLAMDMGAVGKDLKTDEFKVSICVKDAVIPYSYKVNQYLLELCKKNDLDFAFDVYPHYGSDIMPVLNAGYGGDFALFGPGVAASHSYERTHEKGLYNTMALLYSFMTDLG